MYKLYAYIQYHKEHSVINLLTDSDAFRWTSVEVGNEAWGSPDVV